MEVKFEKKDWEEARNAAITIIKTIMAQKLVYELQLEIAERELAKYPKEEIKKEVKK
jgi:hypothetical protein